MSKKYYFNIHKQRKTAINSVFALILMLLMFVNSFIYFTSDVYAQEEITRLGESIANFGQSVSNIQNTATKFTFNQVQNAKEISSNASNTIKSAINNAFAFCKNKASKVKNKITNKAIQTKNYLSSNISNLFTSSEQSNQPQQLTITNEGQVSIKNIENVTQIEQVTQVEKVIKTTTLLNEIVNPADLTSINNELDSLSGKIDNLANQISNKINYSTPSYAPVSVSSSGIQVSGHSLLSSLNVSGSGSIGGSLSVRQNFSIGNTKDNITPTFNVYADSTFNNSASFNSGLSATTLSVSGDTTITGALTLATSTIAQLTITNDLLVSGNATTTGSFYIGADLNVVGDMGILDTDVPDTITASNYLLLTGGTLTGGLTMLTTTSTNSTSTNLYISNDLTVGGNSSLQKATSTFLYASGDITSGGSFYGSLTGNADTATNLADYSSAYTWTGINTFSSDVRITGALHATTTDFDLLMVNGSATT
ncbi:MAG: hypothetical protein HQ537_01430, partial [Parcubacteria group bacterium]|nr:hypothetical protein [Parcubacteria group bacterium]